MLVPCPKAHQVQCHDNSKLASAWGINYLGSSSVIDTSFGDIAPDVALPVDWEVVGVGDSPEGPLNNRGNPA
jgi:hypothetical protein